LPALAGAAGPPFMLQQLQEQVQGRVAQLTAENARQIVQMLLCQEAGALATLLTSAEAFKWRVVELASLIHERAPTPPPPPLPGGWAPLTSLGQSRGILLQYSPMGGRPFFTTARATHPVTFGAPLAVLSICTFGMRAYVHRQWPLITISLHRAEGLPLTSYPAIDLAGCPSPQFAHTQLVLWASGSAPSSCVRTLVTEHAVELYIEEQLS